MALNTSFLISLLLFLPLWTSTANSITKSNPLEKIFEQLTCDKIYKSSQKNSKAEPILISCYNSKKFLVGRLFGGSSGYQELYTFENDQIKYYRLDKKKNAYLYKWGKLNEDGTSMDFENINGEHQQIPLIQEQALCSSRPDIPPDVREFLQSAVKNPDKNYWGSDLALKVKINPECENYVSKNFDTKFLKENQSVSRYIREMANKSLTQGIRCLEKLTGDRPQQDLAQLYELLKIQNRDIQIDCGASQSGISAHAHSCQDPQWPGMEISNFPITENTFFHEIFHVIDPRNLHFTSQEPDRTISCEACCFGVAVYVKNPDLKFHCAVCQNPNSVSPEDYLTKVLSETTNKNLKEFIFQEVQNLIKNSEFKNPDYLEKISSVIFRRHPDWQNFPWDDSIKATIQRNENIYFQNLSSEKQKEISIKEKEIERLINFKKSTKSLTTKKQLDMTIKSEKSQIESLRNKEKLLSNCSQLRSLILQYPEQFTNSTNSNTEFKNKFQKISNDKNLPPYTEWGVCFQRR